MRGTEGAPKTKIINGKRYRLAGVDMRDRELEDLKSQGYSVRNFYNKMYRERYTYIHVKGR